MRRHELEELDVDQCLALLDTRQVGRVALNDDRGPAVFPVNYVLDRGTVVFRSDLGTKVIAAEARRTASFQVDEVAPDGRAGWSVLIRGRLEDVIGPDVEHLRALDLVPAARGDKQHYVRLLPASITGRRVFRAAETGRRSLS